MQSRLAVTAPADVSVVVVNYNGARWLPGCLTALLDGGAPGAEIIVVDNASTDGSAQAAARALPSVRFLFLQVNRGYGAGANAGAAASRGRLLAFLNNDTRVRPGWAGQLAAAIDADHTVGLAASCLVYADDPGTVDSAGDGFVLAGGAFKRGHGGRARDWDGETEVFGACGAAFAVRRDLFERLGGFDEDFFLVHEDVDLSYRARLLGYRCVYVPGAVVHHAVSASLGRLSDQAVYYGQRNLEWTYLRNTPPTLLVGTLPLHVGYLLAAAGYFARMGRLRPYLRAKRDALRGLPVLLEKRRRTQAARQVSAREIRRVMTGSWVALKIREKGAERRLAAAPESPGRTT